MDQRHIGRVAAVHAGHRDEVGVVAAQRAQAHQRIHGGSVGQLDEFAEFGRGIGRDDAAAGVDQRPLGFLYELRGAAYLPGVAFGEHLVAGEVDGGHGLIVAHRLEDNLS